MCKLIEFMQSIVVSNFSNLACDTYDQNNNNKITRTIRLTIIILRPKIVKFRKKKEKIRIESNTVQEFEIGKLINKTLELIWRQA